MAASKSVDLAIYDASDQLAYAVALDDSDAIRAAVQSLTALRPDSEEPSDEVREVFIAADPVSAAAIGWLTFQELTDRVHLDPAASLDQGELRAFEKYGDHFLRLIVANRTVGAPMIDLLSARKDDIDRSAVALAARGRVEDPDAVFALLREHGLLNEEELDS